MHWLVAMVATMLRVPVALATEVVWGIPARCWCQLVTSHPLGTFEFGMLTIEFGMGGGREGEGGGKGSGGGGGEVGREERGKRGKGENGAERGREKGKKG